jgi:hypothetical protein
VIWESGKLLTAKQTRRLSSMTAKDRDLEVQLIAKRLRKKVGDTPSNDGGASSKLPSPSRTPSDAVPPIYEVQLRLFCEYPTISKLKNNLVYSEVVNVIAAFEFISRLASAGPLDRPRLARRRRSQISARGDLRLALVR